MSVHSPSIGIVGAGTMGAGIAQVCAQAGFETSLYDISGELVDKGLARIRGSIQRNRERGKLSPEAEKDVFARLSGSLHLEDFRHTTLVVEAAPESMELKRQIFTQLDALCGPETLLATNT